MKIRIVTPTPPAFNNGNKITAVRLGRIFRALGHKVSFEARYTGAPCDLLIALHARRSARSVRTYHERHPNAPLVLILTGTDLYRDIATDARAQQSLELATRIVVLQQQALEELPKRLHSKTRIIYQSAEPYPPQPPNPERTFRVCVIGHLREEKDPLRTPLALGYLPESSKIEVLHIGKVLDRTLGAEARKIAANDPRYRLAGELPYWMTRRVLSHSHLVVISSYMEGSSNVLSEALASSVPVLAAKIPGLIGTLGKDYPGYFRVGDTADLARLLHRAETDKIFYHTLKRRCARVAPLVQPRREINSWKLLLRELEKWSTTHAAHERGAS